MRNYGRSLAGFSILPSFWFVHLNHIYIYIYIFFFILASETALHSACNAVFFLFLGYNINAAGIPLRIIVSHTFFSCFHFLMFCIKLKISSQMTEKTLQRFFTYIYLCLVFKNTTYVAQNFYIMDHLRAHV